MWAHSVGVGQRVVEGATLLIVEVMKTEFPIESPTAGTVTWLAACGEAGRSAMSNVQRPQLGNVGVST